jgi:uncharacterized protein (DUF362 family)
MSDLAEQVIVSIATEPDGKFHCLEEAIEAAGLKDALNKRLQETGKAADQLRVFIKPDLAFFFKPATTITDPELVEHLVGWLKNLGFTSICVGVAKDSSGFWLDSRDPMILADLAGYHFDSYDFANLSEDLSEEKFPTTSILRDCSLSSAWMEADFRIVFAKCRTDEEFVYAGALQSLLGILPNEDTELQYYHRLRPEDLASELVRLAPPQFAIVDAFIANQGSAGSRHRNPLHASTVIASSNCLLADWAVANKLGVDPYRSVIVAKVLREQGLPSKYSVSGDLTPLPAVKNVHPMVADAVMKRNTSLDVQRSAAAWLQTVDRELFAFKDALTDRINRSLAAQFGNLDADPLAFASFLTLNYSLAGFSQFNESSKILFMKDQLHWMERPLNMKIDDLSAADYEASKTYMEPLEEQVMQLSPDSNGMRMQYLDNSVLFHFSRHLPIPFDDFVERVDISKSIRMMNDYIGGACVPVLRDTSGRVTHQAERNIYLPQPNYIAFSGGQPIDVSKLEFIEYSDTERKIFWRTIKSENNSARFDDGTVAFTRTAQHETLVSVVGRQEFILPPYWQLMQLDLNPALKDYLVADAYKTFFTNTIGNFTADFEQRPYRIGKPWPGPAQDQTRPVIASERLSEAVSDLASKARTEIDRITSRFSLRTEISKPVTIDAHGFSHFEAPKTTHEERAKSPLWADKAQIQDVTAGAVGFVQDLIQAINKDLARDIGKGGN